MRDLYFNLDILTSFLFQGLEIPINLRIELRRICPPWFQGNKEPGRRTLRPGLKSFFVFVNPGFFGCRFHQTDKERVRTVRTG